MTATSIRGTQIKDGDITDADVATANKDGLAATASMRTLGTGAQQAAAGNDARFTDARTPVVNTQTAAEAALADELPEYNIAASAIRKVTIQKALGLMHRSPGGRLTLSITEPVTSADFIAAATMHYLPHVHDMIELWDGTRWLPIQFTELNSGSGLAVGTLVKGAGYDVFGYLSSGQLAAEFLVWKNATVTMTIASPGVVTWTAHGMSEGDPITLTTTGALPTGLAANTVYYALNAAANTFQLAALPGDTAINTTGSQSGTHTAYQSRARNTAATYQDGRLCKSGDKTRLLLGSFQASSTVATEDSQARRLLSNLYNPVPRSVVCRVAGSWTSTGIVFRQANGSTSSKVDAFFCQPWMHADVELSAFGTSTTSGTLYTAIGVGTILSPDQVNNLFINVANEQGVSTVRYCDAPGLGARTFYYLDKAKAAATNTFFGYTAGSLDASMKGWVMG